VFVNTPQAAHDVLVANARSLEKSPGFRVLLYYLGGNGLFTAEGELWRKQRKLMGGRLRDPSSAGWSTSDCSQERRWSEDRSHFRFVKQRSLLSVRAAIAPWMISSALFAACAPPMLVGDSGSDNDSATPSDTGVAPLPDASGGDGSAGGAFRDGIATYYNADGSGNCSFDPSPQDLMVAAMNTPEWNNSAVCGACAEVIGPTGTVTVRIVDRCPECLAGHLDLSRQAFERIAPIASGRVNTRWRFVPCSVTGPIAFKWKDGTNQWWAAIQVRNHRVPIARVEVRRMDGTFSALDRQDYNYFVGMNLGPGPFTVRVTAQDGQQLTETGIALGDNTTVSGTQQFR
jgi:expansin (peptidoglycan-binding protein)